MKLSLSVRVAEPPRQKDVTTLPIEDLAPLAQRMGFDALSMRASVVAVDSPPARAQSVRALLDELGLEVSMVCGDIPLAANDADATNAIRDITPYLDLTVTLGARLVRIMMQHPDDIVLVQRAADEAAERDLKLTHLLHWGTLFETVDDALDTIARIGRSNVGVTFEPANLLACGGTPDAAAIRRLAPHLFNVCFSNVRLDPDSGLSFVSRHRGAVNLRYVAVDDASGIDARPLIEALIDIGYDGYFTIHQPLVGDQGVEDAMRTAADFFRPMMPA